MTIRITDLTSSFGLLSESGSPNVMRRPHHHDDIELNYLESGAMTYLLGGHQFTVEPGRLLAFWAAVPHQVTWIAARTRLHWLYIPLPQVLAWDLPTTFIDRALSGTPLMNPLQDDPPLDLARFRRWHTDLGQGLVECGKIVLLEVEARLRRLAMMSDGAPVPGSDSHDQTGGSALRLAKQMALFIARHHTEPLTVNQIAQAVNLHPNYAMAIFREQLNASMVEYLTRHRVAHAQRLLLTTDQRVLDVALEAGFGSLSRFYAAFNQFCQQSPGQYRRTLRPDGDGTTSSHEFLA